MKFRWKLLILLLAISIVPIVGLRSFGIQNVRLMADALISQVKGKQLYDARHRLQLVVNEYAKVIRTSREQTEIALFYQTFELRRILQTELLPYNQNKPSPVLTINSGINQRCHGNIAGEQIADTVLFSLTIEIKRGGTPVWMATPL